MLDVKISGKGSQGATRAWVDAPDSNQFQGSPKEKGGRAWMWTEVREVRRDGCVISPMFGGYDGSGREDVVKFDFADVV